MRDRDCPSREELLAYHVGSLAEEAAAAVIDHLSGCAACQAVVEGFRDVDDPVVSRLRRPAADPYGAEPEHRRALAGARAAGGGSEARSGKSSSTGGKSAGVRQLGEYQLLAKLGELTNLQVVEDEASPTGYGLEVGPFLGWEVMPRW